MDPAAGTGGFLLAAHDYNYEMVLTNPPFGKKSSVTIFNAEGEESREALTVLRDDFWATTSNKQLNFARHVVSLLKMNGGAAVVVPDNVLFEGGAGETIRRKLLQSCDVHTLADRGFLCAGREGERAVLRPQTGERDVVDEDVVDLRCGRISISR